MTKCAIYCRISKDREGAGLGVERQEQDCRELAAKLGLTVAGLYIDNDLSAYSGKPRPQYLRMLADIEAGHVGAILTWHTDRLHRSPTELESYIGACERHGVPTHTAKAGLLDLATPSGRLVARQLGAVARYEVEHQIERQQAAKQQAAVAGKWGGGRRPYGYEPDGIAIRPDEAQIVAEATDAVLLGASLRSQSTKLNEAGQCTSTGSPWGAGDLRRVLLRARNAGLREHRGKVIGKAEWPPIVDEVKWRAVRAMLTDPARRTCPPPGRRWLLSGLARCYCGEPVIVTQSSVPASAVPGYTCRRSKHVVRNAAVVDKYVTAVAAERLRQPDLLGLLKPSRPGVDVAALTAEETDLRERLDALADDLGIDERSLARRSQKLRERLEQIGAELAEAGRGSALSGIVDAPDPGAAFLALEDLDRRRAVISALMSITILPARKGRPSGWRPGQSYFDPETIRIE